MIIVIVIIVLIYLMGQNRKAENNRKLDMGGDNVQYDQWTGMLETMGWAKSNDKIWLRAFPTKNSEQPKIVFLELKQPNALNYNITGDITVVYGTRSVSIFKNALFLSTKLTADPTSDIKRFQYEWYRSMIIAYNVVLNVAEHHFKHDICETQGHDKIVGSGNIYDSNCTRCNQVIALDYNTYVESFFNARR